MTASGPGNLHSRLSSAAKASADERELLPDRSAQDALGGLVSQAVERLGREPSEEDIVAAERAFDALAGRLAGDGRLRHAHEDARRPRAVSGREVQSALLELCPGFWPFC